MQSPQQNDARFGVVVACCKRDLRYLKGCLASIRYYSGAVPIHLIYDGPANEPLRRIAGRMGCTTAVRDATAHPGLREHSFGWGLTKMTAFWECPFERFLFLDADTVVHGDLCDRATLPDADLVGATHGTEHDAEWLSGYFYQPDLLTQHWPDFDWRRYLPMHFMSGCFFARRGMFDVDWYLELLAFARGNPGVFAYGDQGILNFMAFTLARAGKIRVAEAGFPQLLVGEHAVEALREKYPFREQPTTPEGRACIHWAGRKPDFYEGRRSELMTRWRAEYQRQAGSTRALAWAAVAAEDLPVLRWKARVKTEQLRSRLRWKS